MVGCGSAKVCESQKNAHKPVYLFWLNKLQAAFPKYRGEFPLMISRIICSFTDRVDATVDPVMSLDIAEVREVTGVANKRRCQNAL